MKNRIITLTTDYGDNDAYAGAVKGVILSINPNVVIVDITHQLPRHNILKGAFVLYSSFNYFPRDTIHLAVVDPQVGGNRKPIIVEAERENKKFFFVGPDNGIFSFIYKDCKILSVIEIKNSRYILPNVSNTFHGRDIFAPVSAYLSLGIEALKFGEKIDKYKILDIKSPKITDNTVEGEVIYIDNFGNLVTNVSRNLIQSKFGNERFIIQIKSQEIQRISNSYSEVKTGKLLAIFGSGDFLEISVNQGNAKEFLQANIGEKISITNK